MRRIRAVSLLVAALLTAVAPTNAVETRFWELQEYGDFLRGDLDGISLRRSGELLLAPDLVRIPLDQEKGGAPPPFLWDAVLDRHGNLFVGSGLRGLVYRIDARGEATVFFQAPEIEVQALAIDARGNLLVGASPPGRLYRVTPEGEATLLFETGERYLWDLAVDGETTWVATGESGILFRVSEEGEGEPAFDSDEAHLVSLALTSDHEVIAGSSGSGLVYRISPDGGARVLFDSDGQEVAALAVLPSGTIYAAVNSVVPPEKKGRDEEERKEPEEKLTGELPEGPTPMPGGLEELTQGDEEIALSAPPRQETLRLRSSLHRIGPGGDEATAWSADDEGIHCLALQDERLLFGTGVPARLYVLEEEDRPRLLSRFTESQVTSVTTGSKGLLYAVTSNQGRVYRAAEEHGHSGTFLSPVKDAGSGALWGRISWLADAPAGTRVEVATRSGNSSRPDRTWSDWSLPYGESEGAGVISPGARYLQFRARLSRLGDAATPRMRMVSVSFQEQNRPPEVSDVSVARIDDGISYRVQWSATDPNGDRLSSDLSYRRTDAPGDGWIEVAREIPGSEQRWDTGGLPSGRYQVQVRTTDLPDNDAATAGTALARSDLFVVDHVPPRVEVRSSRVDRGKVRVSLQVIDDYSPVVRLELSATGLPRRRLPPVDGLDDSIEESYDVVLDDLPAGRHVLRFTARDRPGNVREAELPVEVDR